MIEKRKVIVPRFAYELIISATSEVWKREVYGLIGGRGKNVYYITKVFPNQTAERKYSQVEFYSFRDESLGDAIKRFGGRVIGDFHSHNYYNGSKMKMGLGVEDIKFLKKHPELISILVCTKEVDKFYEYWRICDNIIYGPITSKDSQNKTHKLKTAFMAYYYEPKLNRVLKAKLKITKGLEKLLNKNFK